MSRAGSNSSPDAGKPGSVVEHKLSRSSNAVLIEQAEVIDKEAAYKQRLNRPFKVIQHLPLSKDDPNYEQLENPLSTRDSATLYNSLIVSRHNWLHNVFRTFWTRREQYMTPADGRKKDRLSKMCDMKLVAGPHTFEIRLFILKEEEKEKRYFEELERKREERQKLKDERVLKPIDPSPAVATPPVKKEAAAVPLPKTKAAAPVSTPAPAPTPAPAKTTATTTPSPAPKSTESLSAASKQSEESKSGDLMANPENAMMIQNLNLIARSDAHLSSLMKIVASGNASSEQIAEFQRYIQKARQMGDPSGYYKKLQQQNQNRQPTTSKPQDFGGAVDRRQLTREEREKLKQQEKEQKAKLKEEKKRQKQLQKEQEKLEKDRERQERKERKARLERERQERQKLNLGPIDFGDEFEMDKEREKKEKREKKRQEEKAKLEKLLAGDDRLTAFQERYTEDATLIIEFLENNASRFYFPKDSVIEIIDERNKPDDKNDEQNGDDSSLKPASSPTPPPSASASELSKKYKDLFVELLISFIIVHNQPEIDAYEARKKREEEEKLKEEKEKEERQRQEEEGVDIKQEDGENGEDGKEEDDAEDTNDKKKNPKKKRRAKRNWGPAKRQTRTSRHVNDEDLEPEDLGEEDVKPVPIYSTSTLRLVEVPYKFANLIKNSATPLAEVQQKMKEIMATGQRLDKYHVWYQLDGIKDELLAETLRFNLNRLEYISGGGKLKGKAMLKRIVEKSGSEAEVSNKRQRRTQTS
ncbi:hypothetical protein OGAPHI_004849 [Ogataea philodendri]|uniref:SWR1-complex protein 3 n=2 Tax=Saccharomycotina TaxID=147537 RepID=A0A9P8P2Z6_9ASCO|nr:uncharacterized protein OGAPHI_004849 [Ogataea philodendri]KAH3664135.1 hypothetical protein OGAPHI_004849 [Ogataea philodendri]